MKLSNSAVNGLAEKILEDAELGHGKVSDLVLKASRLARLINDEENYNWLQWEIFGYDINNEVAQRYITWTGRWINYQEKTANAGSLSSIENFVETLFAQLDSIKSFSPSGEYANAGFNIQQQKVVLVSNQINTCRPIIERVRALIQRFASKVYYGSELAIGTDDIFTMFSNDVDLMLAERAGEAVKKFPHIFKRLQEGDAESISQALTSCRRVMDAFADAIYPARSEQVALRGDMVSVTKRDTKNRYRCYINDRVESKSVYEKITKVILLIYDRFSTGVHSEVSAKEAQSLVLIMYVTLGEILHLGNVPSAPPLLSADQ